MQNIDKLLARKKGETFTFAQIREWFFNGDQGMTRTHLERVTRKINDFITAYQKCKFPLAYLVKAKCGHLGGKTQKEGKGNKIFHKCSYIKIEFSAIVDGVCIDGSHRRLPDIHDEVVKQIIANKRVLRHDVSDILSLSLASLERSLEQFIINARDPYFRVVDRTTPEHLLAAFRGENAHRIVEYTYKASSEWEGGKKLKKPELPQKYAQIPKSMQKKSKINPNINLTAIKRRASYVEEIIRGLEEDGF